jgi:hypothetical protein
LSATFSKSKNVNERNIELEEEYTMINNYLNSIKLVKEVEMKKETRKKTMKEIIAEALLEKE